VEKTSLRHDLFKIIFYKQTERHFAVTNARLFEKLDFKRFDKISIRISK